MALHFTKDEMLVFLEKVFPQIQGTFGIDELGEELLVMRMHPREEHLRPGGTISGPSMFSLADVAAYVATMARIGREALTVTTHCSIDFMRKPEAGRALIAETRVLKLGRSLSVSDVLLFSEGITDPVAHASLTYSIPPKRS
ncbi:MAG: PaaI family thioesterase [Marinovum sp.]|nr:PaaI family thioesterase [Marinovum sp.]